MDYLFTIEDGDAAPSSDIRLASWSWGGSNPGTMQFGGTGGGEALLENFDFTMSVNSLTPRLVEHLVSGEPFARATLTCRKPGATPHEYLKITLEDVVVASYRTSGAATDDQIAEDAFSLNFAKIKLEYHGRNTDGTPSAVVTISQDISKEMTI